MTLDPAAMTACAAQRHLHKVLAEIDSHCDSAAFALPVVSIRSGAVTVQTAPADLDAVVVAFDMGTARGEPVALSSGADWVVIPYAAERTYDGAHWRVWAPRPVTHAEFARLKAARRHAPHALEPAGPAATPEHAG